MPDIVVIESDQVVEYSGVLREHALCCIGIGIIGGVEKNNACIVGNQLHPNRQFCFKHLIEPVYNNHNGGQRSLYRTPVKLAKLAGTGHSEAVLALQDRRASKACSTLRMIVCCFLSVYIIGPDFLSCHTTRKRRPVGSLQVAAHIIDRIIAIVRTQVGIDIDHALRTAQGSVKPMGCPPHAARNMPAISRPQAVSLYVRKLHSQPGCHDGIIFNPHLCQSALRQRQLHAHSRRPLPGQLRAKSVRIKT